VSGEYGLWVEDLVREVAAGAGVPDFVFKALHVDKGSARREVGDALLWIGHQLVVVSIKSRDPGIASDTPERRDAWLAKNIRKAVSQISGTVRTLKNPPPNLILQSERGVGIPWDPRLVDEIFGVVVVDHRDIWDFTPDLTHSSVPTVALASDDWRVLHDRLWSTASVVSYIRWRSRSGLPTLPFIAERDVIASSHIAQTDLPRGAPFEVKPGAWDEAWQDRPELFFGTHPDHRYARVVDAMIAGAAEQNPLYTNGNTSADYLHIIEFLDRIPPFTRVELGKGVIRKCESVGEIGGYNALITYVDPGLLVVLADSSDRARRTKLIQGLTMARHTQLVEATGLSSLTTLGVATEPSPSSGRSHDFVLIRGEHPLSGEECGRRDELFGPLPPQLPAFALSRSALGDGPLT
jgi:hypothetical protein